MKVPDEQSNEPTNQQKVDVLDLACGCGGEIGLLTPGCPMGESVVWLLTEVTVRGDHCTVRLVRRKSGRLYPPRV